MGRVLAVFDGAACVVTEKAVSESPSEGGGHAAVWGKGLGGTAWRWRSSRMSDGENRK